MMSGVSSFCDILNVKVVGDPDWRQRFVVLSNSTLWIYGDDQDPRRTKIHPVRDLSASRRISDGSQLVLHIKNIAKLDWFKVKFTSEKHLNAWKKRIRQVKEAWNEDTYLQYLDQKSQLRCPYEPLTRLNRQVPSTKLLKPRLPFSRSRSLQEIISWEKLPMTLTQVNKEVLCEMNDIEAILIKARINILENEMIYNKEMDKMLAAFKKRALWPDYFLMDDKSLIEQTLCKLKESSDTLLHDVSDMWPTCSMVLERLDDLAILLVEHLKSVARTRVITFCHLLRDFRPFLRNNLESVDDIYSDVYSEYFYVERALLPIFRVYKLKGISKKLAVMLAASNNINCERWNELFDLCNETLKETYAELSRLFGDHYSLSVSQLFAFSDKHAAFERNGNMSLFEKFELAKEISEICDSVVPLIKVVIVEGGKRDSDGVCEKRGLVDDPFCGNRKAAAVVAQEINTVKNPFTAFMEEDIDRPGRKRKISVTKSYELKVYSSSVNYFQESDVNIQEGFPVGSYRNSFKDTAMRAQMVS
ncbi:uncharacterized protein LOC126907496 [Daktulosphaira vitifoliae]|uniref:uncharacterized protein LOC126907496 n=1 Tax=Daktulosphaira vitifoliae TaxID=58002 RepID=UPI0021AAB017|nr:uncharacterized protein LOC126907496 [Daktulosphaira vitifoliae]XP_050544788.1 uncharacterized protein LOC126907496 [Daktulosphaira vitifoliae]